MKIKYLYIDDEAKSSVAPFQTAIEDYGGVIIEHIPPLPYEESR
jgi:hypothetical protein